MASATTTRTSTWATAKTWSASEGVTAALMNLEIRDKVNALKSPAYFNCVIDQASDYTITGVTTFTNVDATNLSATLTTGGGAMLLGFSGSLNVSAGVNTYRAYLDIVIDGSTRLGGDDGLLVRGYTIGAVENASFVVMTAALTAGQHTFTLQYKVNNASATAIMYAGAGTASHDIHPRFWGIELL